MSKLAKFLVVGVILASAFAAAVDTADARSRRHVVYGGWAFGPAVGLGIGVGYGWGWSYPYGYYARPYYPRPVYRSYYYARPRCVYERVRVWRRGHWVTQRIRRCWY